MPAWRATHTSHAARAGASATFASDVRKCRNSRTPSRAARTKRRTGPTILNRLVQARCHVAEAERHVAPLGFRPTVYQPMQGVPRPPSGIAFLGDDEVHAFWRASPPFRVARTHRLSEAWQPPSDHWCSLDHPARLLTAHSERVTRIASEALASSTKHDAHAVAFDAVRQRSQARLVFDRVRTAWYEFGNGDRFWSFAEEFNRTQIG